MTRSRGIRPYRKLHKDIDDRFWAKVRVGDGCWEWTAGLTAKGYGKFGRSPIRRAHRVSWEMHKGPIPAGMGVLHKCDNRRCVRPGHLFLGTQTENMEDKVKKGRQSRTSNRGEASGSNILSESDVLEIHRRRSAGETCASIARDMSVCRATVSHIVNGRNWSHIQAPGVR